MADERHSETFTESIVGGYHTHRLELECGLMEIHVYADGSHQVDYFASDGAELVLGDMEVTGDHIRLTVERR